MSVVRSFGLVATLFAIGQLDAATVVGVKLIKAESRHSEPKVEVRLPDDCGDCTVVKDLVSWGENPREIFFHLRVPTDKPVIPGIRVNTGGVPVRAVIVEKNRIPFRVDGVDVVFDLPVVARPRSSTMEVQTSLDWPGIALRIE